MLMMATFWIRATPVRTMFLYDTFVYFFRCLILLYLDIKLNICLSNDFN